jgi:hypothetical protein
MLFTRFKGRAALFLAAGLSGLALFSPEALPADATAQSDLSWIDKRLQEWQPTREERRFDEIGWAKNLRQAQRLAREHKRPLFLFTYDGSATEANAISLRRC